MAGATRIWIGALVGAVLLFGAARASLAQASQVRFLPDQSRVPGSLTGKLTDLHSEPLAGITVILRNESTGVEARTTSAKNGTYRFADLEAGEYTMEADSPRLGRGRLEGIVIYAGLEARVQAAMSFEPPALIASAPAPLRAARKPAPQSLRSFASPSPAVTATLPSEPTNVLPLPAQSTPGPASSPAVAQPPISIASVAAVPSQRLPLASLEMRMPAQEAPKATPARRAVQHSLVSPVSPLSPASPVSPVSPPSSVSPGSAAQLTVPAKPQQLAVLNPAAALKPALAAPLQHAPGPVPGAAFSLAETVAAARAALVAIAPNPPHRAAIVAAAEQLSPVTQAAATTIDAAQLQALPVSGRRWEEFELDSPTAAAPAGSSQAALRGAGQDSAETTIDGANTRLAFGVGGTSGSSSPDTGLSGSRENEENGMGQAWKGGRGLAIGESAIREVQMVAGNVEAKGVYAAGGLTDVETESGANQLHGQSFLLDRQNTWGARNPFTTWLENTGTAEAPVFTSVPFTPPDHETNWGIGLGSHILRDKLFWFAAFDNSQRNDPGLAIAKEPIGTYVESDGTPVCLGFFCPPSNAQVQLLCAQLGLSVPGPAGTQSSCPTAQATADYYGIPGSASVPVGLEQLASLLGPAPRMAMQRIGFGRIDWKLAERHTITIEGIGAGLNAPGGGLTGAAEDYGNHSFGSSGASEQWLLARWEAYLTPNLLAVTQVSGGRTILNARPDTPSAFEQQFLDGNTELPEIAVDSRYGFTIGNPSRFGQGSYPDERLYNTQEMLDWVHNRWLVKAGFELDHDYDATSLLRNSRGTYHYSEVEHFISDALAYENFGPDPSTPQNPHNCGVTATTFGALPCYSYYSQMIGPTTWHLSTNDWAGYVTTQWQPNKIAVFSAGLRWEREQMPPPIAALDNPELPFTEKLPALGNNWGPRVGLAIGPREGHWPVLRLGYGMYFARTENATLESALIQTGSLKGDLNFFIRPTDGFTSINGTSAAPFFPNELEGPPGSVVMPGAVGIAPNFRNPEVHQAIASVEDVLPGRVHVTASALLSLGRRLPVPIDTNINTSMSSTVNAGITYNVCDQAPYTSPGANGGGQPSNTNGQCANLGQGPIKTAQVTIPYFYASWPGSAGTGVCPYYTPTSGDVLLGRLCPDYQAIRQMTSKANSTYEAAVVKLTRYGGHGLSFNAYYTYAHAMDWNPNEIPMDPNPKNFSEEYGTSNLDIRHSATAMVVYETPWKLHDLAGRMANGWVLSGIGEFHSGLPYSMHITGSIPEEFDDAGDAIAGLGPSMNGYGGDNRYPGLPRNTFRYPNTWRADLRLGKSFDLGRMRRLELLAESFNLFNHQNVTEIETTGYTIENGSPPSTSSTAGAPATLPSLNFLTGLYVSPKTGLASPGFGQPLTINGTNFYRERQIELGLRMTF